MSITIELEPKEIKPTGVLLVTAEFFDATQPYELKKIVQAYENKLIVDALTMYDDNAAAAARHLKISYANMLAKIKARNL